MTNKTLRPGNSEETTISLVDGDGAPFQLYDSTVEFILYDQLGTEVLAHTLSIDGFGVTTLTDGLDVVGSPADGVILDTLTSGESTGLAGWHRWKVFITDSNGNRSVAPVIWGGWNFVAESPYIVPNGTPRITIRRRVLQKLGDLIVATASANGTTQTLIDQKRLIGEPNAYRGMQALLTTFGANQGEERYVTGSARDTRSITFDFSLPEATVIGDEVELINFRGTGYHFEDVNRAIATAVDDAAKGAPEPVILANTAAFTRVPGIISIPDDWVAVSGVQWRDDDDSTWQNMTYSGRQLGSGWSVDRANRTVNIGKQMGYRIEDKDTQIVGFRIPAAPEFDDDLVGIDASWVVAECVSLLSSASYRRTPTPDRQAVMAIDQQAAGILRSRVLQRTGPNVIRL